MKLFLNSNNGPKRKSKRLNYSYLIPIISILFCMYNCVSCKIAHKDSETSKSSDVPNSTVNENISEENSVTYEFGNTPSEEKSMNADMKKIAITALYVAKEFVMAQKFAHHEIDNITKDDFSDYECIIECAEPYRFIIMGKFITKNDFGVLRSYVYKIHIQYYGREDEMKDWDYGELIVENSIFPKQEIFHGNMNNRYNGCEIMIDGVRLTVLENMSSFIRIETSGQLLKKDLKAIISELKSSYNLIYICASPKIERGDEYILYSNGIITDYSTGFTTKFENW